jgi:O-antigen ligase
MGESDNQAVGRGPELLRRGLVGAVTALVVARPLVPGEDPGRLLVNTGIADQVFTALWLLVAAGWAIWRAWAKRTTWFGSLVEAGLLALAIVAFASISQATYRHAAWLVAAQWGTLFLAFCLVRQLVRTAGDNRALLAAMLATGVSLAVFAVYQARQPALTAQAPDPTVAEIFDLATEAAPPAGVAATFVQPATFAGFLTLLFPCLVMSALACWRVEQLSWRTGIIVACCCLCGVALFLTQSWWAIVVLSLVGIFALLVWGRTAVPAAWLLAGLVGLLLIDGLVVLIAGSDPLKESVAERWGTWEATWAMIRERTWLGIGAGNFSREFPAKLTSAAIPLAAEPHNFLLEVAATLGLAGLVVLLITLFVFFRRMRTSAGETDAEKETHRTSWEFYLGGVAGLSLGFVLRYAEVGSANALIDALVALCRSLVWLGAFAVLESVPWAGRNRALALTAGVAALLLNLIFEGGIGFPSLAQPLWVMVALTLNALPEPAPAWEGRHWVGMMLPAPILGVLCMAYFLFVLYPAATAASTVADARRYYVPWADKVVENGQELPSYEMRWRMKLQESASAKDKILASEKADRMLHGLIIDRLERANAEDPSDERTWAELAYWNGKSWQLYADLSEFPDENVESSVRRRQERFGERAIAAIDNAQYRDPKGEDGYWVASLLCMQFSKAAASPDKQREQFKVAAINLGKLVERDPMNARYHFLLADMLHRAGDAVQARAQAKQALDLDEQAGRGRRRLTASQHEQALKWAADTTVR